MTIGIFGGSFNPVHNGHIKLAQAILENTPIDRVWFTLSPRNPLKEADTLESDTNRLIMLQRAVRGIEGVSVCDIELSMPRPSYTIDTLRYLSKKYPEHKFRLIIGADNWQIFDQWRDYKEILISYKPIVYPRPGYPLNDTIDVPKFDISSTQIRDYIAKDWQFRHLVPPAVATYIEQQRLYGYKP
jgi:nicotinate-nucleotide adenylyltransferase